MIIKELKLKNFGVHKDVNFNTEGKRIIGLLGKNGSGKSTILNAIKYAFTSEIPGTIESNLRSGSKSGFVEIKFMYGGETGTIKRTIGKASKASLVWKGTSLTVKKDIENSLFEILGVDKKSLSSAVFLSQGSLNNLLFGSDSDREELFVKVMNMSYCQKFAEVIDQKSKTLLDGNDNISIIDELNRQRIELSERLEIYKEDLKKYPACEAKIELLEERSKLTSTLANNIEIVNDLNLKVTKYSSDLKKLGLVDISQEAILLVQKELDTAQAEHDKLENYVMYRDSVEIINTQLQDYKNEIKQDQAEVDSAQKKVKSLKKSMEEKGYVSKISNLDGKIEILETWLETYLKAAESGDSSVECYVCGTDHQIDDSKSKKLVDELSDYKKELTQTKDDLSTENENIKKLVEEINIKERNIHVLIGSVKENELSKENLKLNVELHNEFENTKVTDIQNKINLLENKTIDLKEHHTKLCADFGQSSGLNAKIDNVKERISEINQETELVKNRLDNLESYDGNIEDLKAMDLTHKSIASKLEEIADTYTNINKRYNTLIDQNETAELKKEVHKELQRLKDVFSRKGLPKTFVDSRFEILTELTQKNLEAIDTDFFIEQSTEKSLAFDYNVIYEGDRIKLPMHKLSGGQRVRLSLAFILAVQQLIVADLGFVTLDEPSTHLDEEGVDSLSNLLKKVRDVFADSEHQLWVCDHNPKLDSSFDKILKL